jgi:hypothetical protein
MRHLRGSFTEGALRRGAAIAQWIPDSPVVHGRATISWLRAQRRSDGTYVLGRHHVFDEGSAHFIDVWEFSPVDDDEILGVGTDLATFSSGAELLEAAVRDWGADAHRWVNDGMIQDEYRDIAHPPLDRH